MPKSKITLAPSAPLPWRSQVEHQAEELRQALREALRRAAIQKQLTPEVIVAFAALHLTTDDGLPITPAAHHWLWLRLLCDERIKKLLILAPPESAKTSWVVGAWAGCRIGIFPEQNIIIGSASESTAEKRSLSLRTMVQTSDWQTTFPNVTRAQGMKWEAVEWSLAPNGIPRPGRLHPTIAAYGTGGSITGSRADVVLADDLLDFDNSRTSHQRNLVRTWMHNSLLPRRKSRVGRAVVIGTEWHADSVYAEARREGNWIVCHTPLLSETEKVYATLTYPDNWSFERLGERVAKGSLE